MKFPYFNMLKHLKWCIYYIYKVFSGYIQQYSHLDLGFLRPRSNSSGCTTCSRDSTSDTKNLGLGAILLDIALKDPIYTLHIFISHLSEYMQFMIFWAEKCLKRTFSERRFWALFLVWKSTKLRKRISPKKHQKKEVFTLPRISSFLWSSTHFSRNCVTFSCGSLSWL